MASSAFTASNTYARPSLGHIALFIGGIEGEFAQRLVELNEEHVWTRPRPCAHDLADDWTDDEQLEPWRGEMRADINLDGAILCHSFLKPPRRSYGWHHGAMSQTMHTDEKPRDILYPLNTESSISSSAFRIDYSTDPCGKPVPRIIPLMRKSCLRIHMGRLDLAQAFNEDVVLTEPAKIRLPGLSFWLWVPRLNEDDKMLFRANVKAFCHRTNCLDQEYFPGLGSASGDSTLAPTPIVTCSTRTGLTGTVYQEDGPEISRGAFRTVFSVTAISHSHSGRLRNGQPSPCKLVAKKIHLERDSSQSDKKKFREMQENEWRMLINNPHVSTSLFSFVSPIPLFGDLQPETQILKWPLLT